MFPEGHTYMYIQGGKSGGKKTKANGCGGRDLEIHETALALRLWQHFG